MKNFFNKNSRACDKAAKQHGRFVAGLLYALICLCHLFAAPAPAGAQNVRAVRVDTAGAYVQSSLLSDRVRRQWTSSRPLQEDNELAFSEILFGGLGGSIYHPRLLTWDANARFTIKQRFLSNEQLSSDRSFDELLREFNVSGMLLRDHSVSLTALATRSVGGVDGDFLEAININKTTWGGDLTWRLGKFNQVAGYKKSRYDTEGLVENNEERDLFKYQATFRSGPFNADGDFEITKNDFRSSGGKVNGRTGRYSGTLRLDNMGRRTLTQSIYYNRIETDVMNEYIEASASGNFRLLSSLHATASISRRNSESVGIPSHTNSGSATVVHRLYRSIITTLAANATYPHYPDGTQKDLNGSARIDYRKTVPFGSIRAYYEYGARRYEERFDSKARRPGEQSFVYTPGVPMIVENVDVDPTSFEVLNVSRPGTFPQEGIDYLVVPSGDFFEIEALSLGSIQAGDRLLVRYFANVNESFEFDERTPGYGGGANVGTWLSVFAGQQRSNRDLLYGNPTATIEDTEVDNANARVNWRGVRLDVRYQNRITTINPYKRRSAGITFSRPFAGRVNLALNSSYVVTDFPQDGDRLEIVTGSSSLWYRIRRDILIESRINAAKRTGRQDDGHDLVLVFKGTYKANKFDLGAQLNVVQRKVDIAGTEVRNLVSFDIKRRF